MNLALEAVEYVAAFRSYARVLIKGLSAVYSELEVFERLAHGETGSLVCRQLTGEVFFVLIVFLCTVNRWMYAYYYSSVVSHL